MGSVCLISQTVHARIVSHFYNCFQITADSIICRVIHQYSNCIRVFCYRFCHLFSLHPQGNAQMVVHFRIHIHRNRTAEYKCIDHTAMYISRKNDLISSLTDRKHHRLHGACGTSDHKKCVCCTKSICRQFFRLADDRNRMAQIIQRFHTVHVNADATLP